MSTTDVRLLELMAENAELRALLAEAQEECIELAIDAGELHAEVAALRQRLDETRMACRPEPTRTPVDDLSDSRVSAASTDATQPVEL